MLATELYLFALLELFIYVRYHIATSSEALTELH